MHDIHTMYNMHIVYVMGTGILYKCILYNVCEVNHSVAVDLFVCCLLNVPATC